MQINFTTTATRRPEVYARTLVSFKEKLRGINLKEQTLYLNIDPLPEKANAQAWEMVALAHQYFKEVIVNEPRQPNFAAAVKWCWQQPQTPYFFHLEDDWELTEPIALGEMAHILDIKTTLTAVGLRAYNFVTRVNRICLSPGLFRTADARVMADRMVDSANPERQLRLTQPDFPHGGAHGAFIAVQFPANEPRIVLRDIGREWLAVSGYRKATVPRKPMYFNHWERA